MIDGNRKGGGEHREDDEWTMWWEARLAAMESVLGKSDDVVGHAVVPFSFGPDMGGAADIVYFRHHIEGVVSVTCELIGCDEQIRNCLGNYELMICHRDDEEWGAELICRLAQYTLEAELQPGHTMDIGPATPEGSSIDAFLFLQYAQFQVRDRDCGLLLCLGITARELEVCRAGERDRVEQALRAAEVYPYTDLYRDSVI